MNGWNAILTRLADGLFRPFAACPAQVPLVLWSAVTGVLMAWLFGRLSNQRALKVAGDKVRAELLAIKLFRHDPVVTWRCLVELLKAAGRRLALSLPAMLVLGPLTVLILVQFALRFEHRPVKPGESVIVELQLAPAAWQERQPVTIGAGPSVIVETPPLRDDNRYSVDWRVRAASPSPALLQWPVGARVVVAKSLAVAADVRRLQNVAERRAGPGWLDRVLHPAEPGFDGNSPVRAVVVHYPKRSTPIFGLGVPWWLTFFAVSMLAALAARRWLRLYF